MADAAAGLRTVMAPEHAPLIPEQRQDLIVRHLRREQVLSYRQLASLVGASNMTVRRDIASLERQGLVIVTSGGARLASRLVSEPSRREKAEADLPEKAAMAREAAAMVEESMTVYLDAGTTIQAMRPFLDHFRDLTVVTNDLAVVAAFLDHPTIEVISLGGPVDKANQSTVGRLAAMMLRELSLDLAFLSSSSWDLKHGVTTPVEAKIEPKVAAMASASSSVLVAGSAKYGQFSRYRVAGLDAFDVVVTDDQLRPSAADSIAEHGVRILRARADSAAGETSGESGARRG